MSGLTVVTGGTGFVGRYLVDELARLGRPVRIFARCGATLQRAHGERVEVVEGDVRDAAAVRRAVRGAATVLHLAACARAWARDAAEFDAVNCGGVAQVLGAVREYGVRRLVHVSTVLTLPPFRPAAVSGHAARPTPYEATKLRGEAMVERYAAGGGHAVIVHPTRVYGPGPLTDANGVTRAVALYLAGRLRVRLADRGALANYVHAADVARGILLAARHGRSGAHYVLGGEDASFTGLLETAAGIAGWRRWTVPLPVSAALALAGLAEAWGALGGCPPFTRGWVRSFLEDRRADITPARAELGYAPRSLATGLTETIAWLARGAPEPWRRAA